MGFLLITKGGSGSSMIDLDNLVPYSDVTESSLAVQVFSSARVSNLLQNIYRIGSLCRSS